MREAIEILDRWPGEGHCYYRLRADDGFQETMALVGNGSVTFVDYLASGEAEFFYVKVEQLDDGDQAWTAPIWIDHERSTTQRTAYRAAFALGSIF